MATRSAATNERSDVADQILRALPEPCTVQFRGEDLRLDVPEAEALMIAKARTSKDYRALNQWVAHDGEIYVAKPKSKELQAYKKAYKSEPPVVPESEVAMVIGLVNAAKLRQTATLVRGCADAAMPGQLPMDNRRLAVLLENEGGFDSQAGVAARRLCGIDGPKEDTDNQPSPFDSSKSADTDSKN